MKKAIVALLFIAMGLWLVGCTGGGAQSPESANSQQGKGNRPVTYITAEEAKARLDQGENVFFVDVRTMEEFEEEHIKDAILLPLDAIQELAKNVLPNKDAVYFVYCRSGNRSKTAAAQLIEMGYQNVYDLGGINDWPYEKESEK